MSALEGSRESPEKIFRVAEHVDWSSAIGIEFHTAVLSLELIEGAHDGCKSVSPEQCKPVIGGQDICNNIGHRTELLTII